MENRKFLILIVLLREVCGAQSAALHGFPYVYYTPETDWAFGGTAIPTFRAGNDTTLKPSSITLDAYYTVRKQVKSSITPEIYLSNDRFLLTGSLAAGRIVDRYWGIGPGAREMDGTEFVRGMWQVLLRAEAQIAQGLWAGVTAEAEKTWILDRESNALLGEETTPGRSGGMSAGTGVALTWDTRDNIYYPSEGDYHQVSWAVYGHYAGSDFTFRQGTADLRKYVSFGRHILAFQIWGMMTGGSPPFYRYAALGGDYIMRGYYTGRFRDRYSVAAQAEYRVMVIGPLGAVAFAGCGEVTPGPLTATGLLPSFGGGIRVMIDRKEKLTVRLDAGWGERMSGIYLDLREAF